MAYDFESCVFCGKPLTHEAAESGDWISAFGTADGRWYSEHAVCRDCWPSRVTYNADSEPILNAEVEIPAHAIADQD